MQKNLIYTVLSPNARTGVAGVFLAVAMWMATHSGAAAECNDIAIDKVWTGTRVAFGGEARSDIVYIAYYDAGRRMTVASVDPKACTVLQKKALPSVFAGWDSHNEIVVASDSLGGLHIVGNMHASKLVYFRGRPSSHGLQIVPGQMTGIAEERVTYPRFLTLADRRLAFLYRSGVSGDGDWQINVLSGNVWSKISRGPILGSNYNGKRVSAYPSELVKSADGFLHLAIVWRYTSDVASNFRASYAKTRDFLSWFDASGHAIALPISPSNADTIDDPGQLHGLVNNARISLGPSGQPVVAFTKFNSKGLSAVFLARHDTKRWHISEIANALKPNAIKGGGSIAALPRFSSIRTTPDGARIDVSFPGEAAYSLDLDGSLSVTGRTAPVQRSADDHDNPDLVSKVAASITLPKASEDAPVAMLRWAAQAPNSDKPRECTVAQPRACDPPPSTLRLSVHAAR
ncbi:MAG: BNR repeat-containing protein [Hyphomicrobiaceae bacterium]